MTRIRKLFFVFLNLGLLIFAGSTETKAQRYLTDLDTSMFFRDTLRPVLKRFENIRLSGYMQPQFQVASADGTPAYGGGNFSQFSRSRFMLRRARIKIDYLMVKNRFPKTLFTFQIDATERGVSVRDMFLRLYETSKNNLSLMAGFFARPFGFEVNLGSSFRETPERGRMSQILMPGERDIGVMLVFEPQRLKSKLSHFRWDAGFFNGQGQSGTTDFDSHKDFITRVSAKPFRFGATELSGGLSFLHGGWKNGTKYVFRVGTGSSGEKAFVVDSSIANLGRSSSRHYYGGDIQVKLNNAWGATELRAEYWFGTQPGTSQSTTNPGTLPSSNGLPVPTYVRHFDGAFFYFLQDLVNHRHQFIVKYDWYDPNSKVSRTEIGRSNTNFSLSDIKFQTWGFGYVFHMNTQTKLILYYDLVRNEPTALAGYLNDLADNIFTCRLQFRF